jgi:hypothetical protein
MDTYRIAAAEQLRCYAAILGVGFQHLETVTSLAQAIEENRSKDLNFIDTRVMRYGDIDSAAGLARFLATRSDIDTHLVLSSSMKSADLSRMVDTFEIFWAAASAVHQARRNRFPLALSLTKPFAPQAVVFLYDRTTHPGRPAGGQPNRTREPDPQRATRQALCAA